MRNIPKYGGKTISRILFKNINQKQESNFLQVSTQKFQRNGYLILNRPLGYIKMSGDFIICHVLHPAQQKNFATTFRKLK